MSHYHCPRPHAKCNALLLPISQSRSEADLERAWDAVRHARHPRVHVFLATSPIHMEHKLRMTPDQVIRQAVESVKHLRSLGCKDIEFSPEDASEPRVREGCVCDVHSCWVGGNLRGCAST